MPHIAVLDADPPVTGDPAAQRRHRARAVRILITDLHRGRHCRSRCGLAARLSGHERPDLIQQAQYLDQGRIPGGRIVPVQVQRGLQAGRRQLRHPRLLRDDRDPCGLPPPLQRRDHAQGLAQGMSHQVERVLHPARPPQRRGVQRRTQRPRPEPLRGRSQLHAPLDQRPGRTCPCGGAGAKDHDGLTGPSPVGTIPKRVRHRTKPQADRHAPAADDMAVTSNDQAHPDG